MGRIPRNRTFERGFQRGAFSKDHERAKLGGLAAGARGGVALGGMDIRGQRDKNVAQAPSQFAPRGLFGARVSSRSAVIPAVVSGNPESSIDGTRSPITASGMTLLRDVGEIAPSGFAPSRVVDSVIGGLIRSLVSFLTDSLTPFLFPGVSFIVPPGQGNGEADRVALATTAKDILDRVAIDWDDERFISIPLSEKNLNVSSPRLRNQLNLGNNTRVESVVMAEIAGVNAYLLFVTNDLDVTQLVLSFSWPKQEKVTVDAFIKYRAGAYIFTEQYMGVAEDLRNKGLGLLLEHVAWNRAGRPLNIYLDNVIPSNERFFGRLMQLAEEYGPWPNLTEEPGIVGRYKKITGRDIIWARVSEQSPAAAKDRYFGIYIGISGGPGDDLPMPELTKVSEGIFSYPDHDPAVWTLLKGETSGITELSGEEVFLVPGSMTRRNGFMEDVRAQAARRARTRKVVGSLSRADLEELRTKEPGRVLTALFSYRTRLLKECREPTKIGGGGRDAREIIYAARSEIATLFRAHGGERLADAAELFEGLKGPNDLLAHAPDMDRAEARRKEQKQKADDHRSGYIVYGGPVSEEQARALREQNDTGLKVGMSDRSKTLLDLLKLKPDDERPIYIPVPLTGELEKQIAVLFLTRPDLAGRTFLLEWRPNGRLIKRPAVERALVPSGKGAQEAVSNLRQIINHKPSEGEIFTGVIVKLTDDGAFVQILPGVEGLVRPDELTDGLGGVKEGDVITVEVVEVRRPTSRDLSDNIYLSQRTAAKKLERGARPLFAGAMERAMGSPALLLGGDVEPRQTIPDTVEGRISLWRRGVEAVETVFRNIKDQNLSDEEVLQLLSAFREFVVLIDNEQHAYRTTSAGLSSSERRGVEWFSHERLSPRLVPIKGDVKYLKIDLKRAQQYLRNHILVSLPNLYSLIQGLVGSHVSQIIEMRLVVMVRGEMAELNFTNEFVRERARFILQNLINNAIKYNREGGQVSISSSEDLTKIYVINTGLGMDPAFAARLLEEGDHQIREGRAEGVEGSGIGWASIRAELKKLGWTAEIETAPGQGTTVIIHTKPGDLVKAEEAGHSRESGNLVSSIEDTRSPITTSGITSLRGDDEPIFPVREFITQMTAIFKDAKPFDGYRSVPADAKGVPQIDVTDSPITKAIELIERTIKSASEVKLPERRTDTEKQRIKESGFMNAAREFAERAKALGKEDFLTLFNVYYEAFSDDIGLQAEFARWVSDILCDNGTGKKWKSGRLSPDDHLDVLLVLAQKHADLKLHEDVHKDWANTFSPFEGFVHRWEKENGVAEKTTDILFHYLKYGLSYYAELEKDDGSPNIECQHLITEILGVIRRYDRLGLSEKAAEARAYLEELRGEYKIRFADFVPGQEFEWASARFNNFLATVETTVREAARDMPDKKEVFLIPILVFLKSDWISPEHGAGYLDKVAGLLDRLGLPEKAREARARAEEIRAQGIKLGLMDVIDRIETITPRPVPQDKPLLFVFDLHGTLLQSTLKARYHLAYETVFKRKPAADWIAKNVINKTDQEIAEKMSAESGRSVEDIIAIFRAIKMSEFNGSSVPPPVEGAVELLKALVANNIPFVVSTASLRGQALKQIEGSEFKGLIQPENVIGRLSDDGNGYDRAMVLEALKVQYPGHTIVNFDDWIDALPKIKESAICVGVLQGSGEEAELNRRIMVEKGIHYVLPNGYDPDALLKIFSVPKTVQLESRDKKIPVAEGPAVELTGIMPTERPNPIRLHVELSDDLESITYGLIDERGVVQQKFTIPSSHLITPLRYLEQHLSPALKSIILPLIKAARRLTTFMGITVSWDLAVDKDVWTTNIDTAFLHKRAKEAGILNDPSIRKALEIGVGGGHGSVALALSLPNLESLSVTDISIYALRVARLMLDAKIKEGLPVKYYWGKGLKTIKAVFDLIWVNPPYIPVPPEMAKGDGDPYRGTGLIKEIVEHGVERLNPDNPNARIIINVSSLAAKDWARYVAEFGDRLVIEELGAPLKVPLKIGAIQGEWLDWLISECGLEVKKDAGPDEEPYWHTLQVYSIRPRTSKALTHPTTGEAIKEEDVTREFIYRMVGEFRRVLKEKAAEAVARFKAGEDKDVIAEEMRRAIEEGELFQMRTRLDKLAKWYAEKIGNQEFFGSVNHRYQQIETTYYTLKRNIKENDREVIDEGVKYVGMATLDSVVDTMIAISFGSARVVNKNVNIVRKGHWPIVDLESMDVASLEITLEELIWNAIKNAPDGSTIEIKWHDATWATSVTNEGKPLGFDPFNPPPRDRSEADKKGTGWGLGLKAAREDSGRNGWRLTYSYENGRHVFRLELKPDKGPPPPSTPFDGAWGRYSDPARQIDALEAANDRGKGLDTFRWRDLLAEKDDAGAILVEQLPLMTEAGLKKEGYIYRGTLLRRMKVDAISPDGSVQVADMFADYHERGLDVPVHFTQENSDHGYALESALEGHLQDEVKKEERHDAVIVEVPLTPELRVAGKIDILSGSFMLRPSALRGVQGIKIYRVRESKKEIPPPKGLVRRFLEEEDGYITPANWDWGKVIGRIKAGIAILGGGPAGASTAIKAAQTLQEKGGDPSDVILVEKRGPEPRTRANEKVCGGFVMSDGLKFMHKELGLDPGAIPNSPINEIHFADGGYIDSPNHTGPVAIISEPGWGSTFHRKDLDSALIRRAQELGVTVLFGGSARSVTRDENGMFMVEVFGPKGTHPVVIDTRLLVGAFGANPNLKGQFFNLMGASLGAEDDLTGIAYRFIGGAMPQGFPDDALRLSLMQIEAAGNEASTYAWEWPAPEENGDPRSNKGLGFCKLEHEKWVEGFDRLVTLQELFPTDEQGLKGPGEYGLFQVRGAILPMYRPGAIPEIVMNGGGVIAVVGDAAGHINPFSGEGITEALNDGMLGVALAKALIAGDLTQVKRYSLANNVSSLALNRRLSYGVASELFHEPMHYRRLFDAILKYPEAGKLLTTFVKRDILGLKDVNAPILKALAMVARTDPSIAVALLKVFREAGRYLGGIIKQ